MREHELETKTWYVSTIKKTHQALQMTRSRNPFPEPPRYETFLSQNSSAANHLERIKTCLFSLCRHFIYSRVVISQGSLRLGGLRVNGLQRQVDFEDFLREPHSSEAPGAEASLLQSQLARSPSAHSTWSCLMKTRLRLKDPRGLRQHFLWEGQGCRRMRRFQKGESGCRDLEPGRGGSGSQWVLLSLSRGPARQVHASPPTPHFPG